MFVNSWQSQLLFSTANMCSNSFHLQVVLLSYMSNSSTHSFTHYRDTPTATATWDWRRQKHPDAHAHNCCHQHMYNQTAQTHSDASKSNTWPLMDLNRVECMPFALYLVWVLQPALWWQWLGWQRWCRTDGGGGKRHPSCFQAACQRGDTEVVRWRGLTPHI